MKLVGLKEAPARAAGLLAIRHVALPLVALALVALLALSPAQATLVVMFAALPTAPTAYVLAVRMGGRGPFREAVSGGDWSHLESVIRRMYPAAAGAAIHMHGGAITCTGPGSIYFKASLKVFNSPGARVAYAFADLPKPGEIPPNRLVVTHLYHDNDPVQGADYEATFSDGSTRTGRTSRAGTVTLEDVAPGAVNIRFGPDCRPDTPVPPDPNPDHRPALGTGDWDALATKHGEPQ